MATNAQGRTDRTLALSAPSHAVRTPVRSTVFRIACWAGGIALWLVLAFAAGAEPAMRAASATSPSRTSSTLLGRVKPSAPSPPRAALVTLPAAKQAPPKALDAADVYRFLKRWTGVHF